MAFLAGQCCEPQSKHKTHLAHPSAPRHDLPQALPHITNDESLVLCGISLALLCINLCKGSTEVTHAFFLQTSTLLEKNTVNVQSTSQLIYGLCLEMYNND